jgi:hypothetical protein
MAGNSISNWLLHPISQYVPLSDVSFGAYYPVMPHELPPSSSVFPSPQWNMMLNIPNSAGASQQIYSGPRRPF